MLALIIVFASAGAAAITGFGFNLVSVPLLTFLYPPRAVVIVTLLLGLVVSGLLLGRREIRRSIDWSLIRPLFLSSLVGMPGGLAMLLLGSPHTLRMLIASLTGAVALLMLIRLRLTVEESRAGTVITGILSGFLSTSTGFNGAPLAFYLIGQRASKERFRGTSVAFVFLATLTSVALLVASRAVTMPIVKLGLTFTPALLLGFAAGIAVARRVAPDRFERVVLAFLAAVGLLNFIGTAP